jgi:hypothetical protein
MEYQREGQMGGTICGRVVHGERQDAIFQAEVCLYKKKKADEEKRSGREPFAWALSKGEGGFEFTNVPEGSYLVEAYAFDQTKSQSVVVKDGCADPTVIAFDLGLIVTMLVAGDSGEYRPAVTGVKQKRALARVEHGLEKDRVRQYLFSSVSGSQVMDTPTAWEFDVLPAQSGENTFIARIVASEAGRHFGKFAEAALRFGFFVSEPEVGVIGGRLGVTLERTLSHPTRDQALWVGIRNRTAAIGFVRYQQFMNRVLLADEREKLDPLLEVKLQDLGTNLHGVQGYNVLRIATEVFLLMECGVRIEEERDGRHRIFHREFESARLGEPVSFEYAKAKLAEYLGTPPQLPYITRVIKAAFPEWQSGSVCCDRVLTRKLNEPCLIELIWSYWNEEGMLAQTMNAVTRRFQNVRGPGDRDPLAHLEIDPLRPMNNIIWGFIQDEIRRLSVKRRAYEYEHQYGLSLYGKAVREMRPADSRSKFLEGFHNLLHLCSVFFKEDNDTTVIADGYPLLNALKEVHLLLAQGAHNQFGDLPWTARAEMMLQQWILARPEIRDFLQSRAMVPYKEGWMPQVDTMKTLQGWSDVTVTHFRDLAVYGEQILLSVRYGDWIAINDEDSAKNWARYWRPELQGYLHGYRAATGIDLTNPDTVDATVPAVLLQKRLVLQQQRAR